MSAVCQPCPLNNLRRDRTNEALPPDSPRLAARERLMSRHNCQTEGHESYEVLSVRFDSIWRGSIRLATQHLIKLRTNV